MTIRPVRKKEPGIGGPMIVALIMGLATPAIAIPAFWIVLNMGSWWIPLLLAYLSLFLTAIAFFLSRKARVQEHAKIGDELFYRSYPDELRRVLRARRQEGYREPLASKQEQYRSWPVPVPQGEKAERLEQKSNRGRLLFWIMGTISFAMAAFLLWGVLIDMQRRGVSVPEVLYLITIAMLVATGISMFRFSSISLLNIATSLMLLFAAWARMILILERGISLPASRFVESIVCFLLFVIAARILPGIASRNCEEGNAPQREWDLYLDLFELGSISEDELKFQLEKLQK